MKQPSHLEGAKKIDPPLSSYDDAVLLWGRRRRTQGVCCRQTIKISMAEQTKTLYFDREANWWNNAIRALL